MEKPEPLRKVELLPKNTYYVYTHRRNKEEYWRRGKVVMIPALLPCNKANATRVAFFNNDIGKTFTPPKKYLKRAILLESETPGGGKSLGGKATGGNTPGRKRVKKKSTGRGR